MGKGPKIAAGAITSLVLGTVIYSTMNLSQYEVEVCMVYNDARECRTAAGATREEAQRTATDTACSFIASGRTASMDCSRTPPESVRWIRE